METLDDFLFSRTDHSQMVTISTVCIVSITSQSHVVKFLGTGTKWLLPAHHYQARWNTSVLK